MISNSAYLKYRYLDNIINPILNSDKRENFLKENIYLNIINQVMQFSKNYPLFGVGNKNYRLETRRKFNEKRVIFQIHILIKYILSFYQNMELLDLLYFYLHFFFNF